MLNTKSASEVKNKICSLYKKDRSSVTSYEDYALATYECKSSDSPDTFKLNVLVYLNRIDSINDYSPKLNSYLLIDKSVLVFTKFISITRQFSLNDLDVEYFSQCVTNKFFTPIVGINESPYISYTLGELYIDDYYSLKRAVNGEFIPTDNTCVLFISPIREMALTKEIFNGKLWNIISKDGFLEILEHSKYKVIYSNALMERIRQRIDAAVSHLNEVEAMVISSALRLTIERLLNLPVYKNKGKWILRKKFSVDCEHEFLLNKALNEKETNLDNKKPILNILNTILDVIDDVKNELSKLD